MASIDGRRESSGPWIGPARSRLCSGRCVATRLGFEMEGEGNVTREWRMVASDRHYSSLACRITGPAETS